MLAKRIPGLSPITSQTALERMGGEGDSPRLIDAQVVEDATAQPRAVPGVPRAGLTAFLDGVQESHQVGHVRGVPIVAARVAAAVRRRIARRLSVWERPLAEWRIYAPLALLPSSLFGEAFPEQSVVDIGAGEDETSSSARHPLLLLERAKHAVQLDRERLEIELAERWCREVAQPLLIDGSISASTTVAEASCAVGAIKSHRTLYVMEDSLEALFALKKGERSAVVRIAPRNRSSVHSWYLRIREPVGRDALWGLVRVEVAESDDPAERADEVSRWVLAESAPLALPDARWDKMVYGVRDCEEFLRAIS